VQKQRDALGYRQDYEAKHVQSQAGERASGATKAAEWGRKQGGHRVTRASWLHRCDSSWEAIHGLRA